MSLDGSEQVGDVPEWLRDALATPSVTDGVTVAGCHIATRHWSADPSAPDPHGLVLVHGGAAHARWWDHMAPLLTASWDVVAVDLSGHGDSGHRNAYRFATWVEEVVAVARAVGGAVVVGHSLGGVVTALTAERGDPAVEGAIVIDAPLTVPEGVDAAEATFSRSRTYRDRAHAERRLRLLPPQPVVHHALLAHVARASVRETPAGWTWKFDPGVFPTTGTDRPGDLGATLERARCPIATVVGGTSEIVSTDERRRLRAVTDPARAVGRGHVELEGGHHHLMFDQPRALATVIDRLARSCLGPLGHDGPR